MLFRSREHVIDYVANTNYDLTVINKAISDSISYVTGTDYDPVLIEQKRQAQIEEMKARVLAQANTVNNTTN